MMPTLIAAAGNENIKEELLSGKTIGGMKYKVHLDGYNLIPALTGKAEWPRHEFLYWTDDGSVAALRYNNWKITFLRQDHDGIDVWTQPYTALRAPMLCNLRMDPFEIAFEEGIGYPRWWVDHMFVFGPAAAYVGQWLQSFREFPPRQKPGSFNLDRVMEAVQQGAGDK
jgi:arylsulfatase